jgi:signal transduction histidine kinase
LIRTRLSLWNALLLGLVFSFIGASFYATVRATVYRGVDEDLLKRSKLVQAHWADLIEQIPAIPPPMKGLFASLDPIAADRLKFETLIMRPRFFDLRGKPILLDDEPWDQTLLLRSLRGETSFAATRLSAGHVRILSVPLFKKGQIAGVGQFASNLEQSDLIVDRMQKVLWTLLPLVLLITTATGMWLTSYALRPVKAIADAAASIEASNLNGRLTVNGSDDFARLSVLFNSMLDRLEKSFQTLDAAFQSQKQFTGDASHELKSPLTAIKTRVGMALRTEQTPERYREHLRHIGQSADTMAAIVQDLLLIARSDEGKLVPSETPVDVNEVVAEAVATVTSDRGRKILTYYVEGAMIKGDRPLLVRVILNLLENACRHTPPDGIVSVQVLLADGQVEISVDDTGEGIPEEDLKHVFDRFYRVESSRDRATGGTGLGLAIVRSVVLSHNGSVDIASEVGKGTRVTLSFPPYPPVANPG